MKGSTYFRSSPHEYLVWKKSGHLHLYSFKLKNYYNDQYNSSLCTSSNLEYIKNYHIYTIIWFHSVWTNYTKNRKFQFTKSGICGYFCSLVLYLHPLALIVSSFDLLPFGQQLEIIYLILGNYIWSFPIWLFPSIAIQKESHNLSFISSKFPSQYKWHMTWQVGQVWLY